jgi:ketosteroid isomerase-like protein
LFLIGTHPHGQSTPVELDESVMSEERVETVERAITAVNERDLDGYLACCTADIQLQTPVSPVVGVYEGAVGIRRFFADIEDASPDFRLDLERLEAAGGERVLAFVRVTSHGRASGLSIPAETGNVYEFEEGKIRRVQIFLDRAEALEAAGLSE